MKLINLIPSESFSKTLPFRMSNLRSKVPLQTNELSDINKTSQMWIHLTDNNSRFLTLNGSIKSEAGDKRYFWEFSYLGKTWVCHGGFRRSVMEIWIKEAKANKYWEDVFFIDKTNKGTNVLKFKNHPKTKGFYCYEKA